MITTTTLTYSDMFAAWQHKHNGHVIKEGAV